MTVSGNVLLFVSIMAAWGAFWMVILQRPALARTKLSVEMARIRDRVFDAVISDDLDADDPAVKDFFEFCSFLSVNASKVSLTTMWGVHAELEREGVDPETITSPMMSRDHLSAEGRRILEAAERDILWIVAWYLPRGSILWPLLTPLQWLLSPALKRAINAMHSHSAPTESALSDTAERVSQAQRNRGTHAAPERLKDKATACLPWKDSLERLSSKPMASEFRNLASVSSSALGPTGRHLLGV